MKIIIRILALFSKKKNTDGLIGEWGVWDTTTNISEVYGELYSYGGRWIPGPSLKE